MWTFRKTSATSLVAIALLFETGCKSETHPPQGTPTPTQSPSPSTIPSTSPSLKPEELVRATSNDLKEKAKELCNQFDHFVYMRKIRRMDRVGAEEGEFHHMVRPRYEYYSNGRLEKKAEIEANYWHATTVLAKDVNIYPYDSFPAPGFFISKHAKFALWGPTDLGLPTKNVDIRHYLTTYEDLYRDGFRIHDRGLGSRNPKMYSSSNEIENKIQAARASRIPQIGYSEAQIHYKPNEILGIYAEVPQEGFNVSKGHLTPEAVLQSVKQALYAKEELDNMRIHVPLVRYTPGKIQFFKSPQAYVRTVLDSLDQCKTPVDPNWKDTCENLAARAQGLKDDKKGAGQKDFDTKKKSEISCAEIAP